MADQVFKIEGLRELSANLEGMSKAVKRNTLKRALVTAGKPIRDDAQIRAPVKTGTLKASIITSTRLSRRQKNQHKKESEVELFIGAGPMPRAHIQEFGSSEVPAQPFMRPAWDTNWRGALASIKQSLTDEIERTRKRLARRAEKLAMKIKAGL